VGRPHLLLPGSRHNNDDHRHNGNHPADHRHGADEYAGDHDAYADCCSAEPAITPGAYYVKVRQATIRKTICQSGWTTTIRPPPVRGEFAT
jgi:hypothetical protein